MIDINNSDVNRMLAKVIVFNREFNQRTYLFLIDERYFLCRHKDKQIIHY